MARVGMMQQFENLKTQSKLLVTFGVISVIIMFMASLGVWTNKRLSQQADQIYADYTVALIDFNQLLFNVNKYHETLQDLAKAPRAADFKADIGKLAPYKQRAMQLVNNYGMKPLRTSSSGLDEAKGLTDLKAALSGFFSQAEAGVAAIAESFESKALTQSQALQMRELGQLALTVSIAPAYDLVTSRHADQIKTIQAVSSDLNDDAKSLAWNGTLVLVAGGLIAVLLGLALGYWVAHKLALGLGQVASVAQLAANGNYQARAKIASKDELGQMATSFNTMLDRITSLVTSEDERNEMQKRLMNFLVLVSEVGKGDLTKRGEVTADMFGNLADGFNLMISRFGQLLKQVREAADRVNKSAGTLRDSAGQMAGTAKHQADESVKTLSAVEQLAAQMRQVAETAGASSESAKQVLQATERGRVAVQETVQDMQSIRSAVQRMSKQVKALGDRSLEISQIVSTIRDIANQTNLLALNAAIEAAGAGEAGARFAVVADQVRKLAESSTQATREIADLVKVIQSETQDAVVAMEQETQAVEAGSASALRTGEVFNEISGIAQRSAELAQTIASSAVTQTASTDQVGRSIRDFTGGAVATQKATDAARMTVEDMAKLADGLTSSVAQFKLA
ncbi:putative Methyl-accepting chemotaxis protein [Nitrospira sp. KM1]|uniref:methyl-accepting chemotaxis protein n=1 Tax=Nitrospira sp. KM1 TaxID=1936990 RepID=UPI0013A71274|nr:methyl-accepting chemotaxis protein [Nitrospira sp. KM1]BCA53636.1 putative Methyl-accepting chemotaxis protein [Nitrospira sp. KM1]